MLKIEELNDALAAGLPEFNRKVWGFPDNPSFLRWFFQDVSQSTMLVAHRDGEWLAALGVFPRTYLLSGNPVRCAETYAWATLPERKGSGLGVRVMKAMSDRGLPLVALGGSSDTIEFMPRLGFKVVGSAPAMSLLLSPRVIGSEAGIAMTGIKATLVRLGLKVVLPIVRPRADLDASILNAPVVALDAATLDMPVLPGFQATYSPDFFTWMNAISPEIGTFLPFRFLRDQELVGWAFARVAAEAPGQTVARILEFKFAPGTNHTDHLAMCRAVTAALAGFGAIIIRSLTTCPNTNAALKRLGYFSRISVPAMVQMADMPDVDQPVRMSSLRADGGVLPIPARMLLPAAHAVSA